jgi:hypothetical protein
MRERIVFKPLSGPVSYCERCGWLCDASCRAEWAGRLERERLQLLAYGWRSA